MLLLLVFVLGCFIGAKVNEHRYKALLPIKEAMEVVEENYYFYDENTRQHMITGAIKGIAAYIEDDYAEYYTAEEYEALQNSNSGLYIGLGVLVEQQSSGDFVIKQVYPYSPAEEAGIMVGDRFISSNGKSAQGVDLDTFLTYLTHEEGDVNALVMERQGQQLSFDVVMRQVYIPYVEYRMLDNSIGYICLTGFHGKVVEETKTAMEELLSQGMTKLVLDVRNNYGGSLYDVCDITELFLDKGSVITTLRSRSGSDEVYKAHEDPYTLPMALLVNGNSASASELLAGALKDHDRARLFGETTFGKGIVQTFFSLEGGQSGMFKCTTDAYYTPGEVCIQGEGISPHELLSLPEEALQYEAYDIPLELDTQLQAAIDYLNSVA